MIDRVETLRAGALEMAEGTIDRMLAVTADDAVIYEWEEFPGAEVFHGPAGLRRIFGKFLEVMPDWRFEPGEAEEIGDIVLAALTARGSGAASGVDVHLELVNETRWRGDEIVLLRFHRDWAAARAAVERRE